MRRLGLSIYPEKDNLEHIKNYLKDAQNIGASRIFSCLLSATKEPEAIKKEFYEMNHYAHQLGYEVILDISPAVFSKLGISYQDLSFFKEIEQRDLNNMALKQQHLLVHRKKIALDHGQ